MAEDQRRPKQPLQTLDHLQTLDPCIMIPRQPSMGVTQLIVLRNVELVRRPDPGSALLEVHLHDAQPGRVAWRVVQCDPLVQVQMVFREGVPLEALQVHVPWQIDTEIRAGSYSPACMLEFLFVHVYGDTGVEEVLEPTGVVEV